jgi:pyridoxal phosphate enzyme (YggS family)
VSKFQPAAAVAAALSLGQLDFGENYAQELRDKSAELGPPPTLRWHFIGPLQRNKVNLVAGRVALIHSVDSLVLIESLRSRLARMRAEQPALSQDCLIEVGLAGEAQKAGCSPAELPTLLDAIAASDGTLRCRGLMCMPPQSPDPESSRPYFRRLRELLQELAATPRSHVELDELSMGMSHDFAVAIAEGATLIRVCTALFGARAPTA